jgi:transcriptional regulator of acetoin/glycerol metabolism
MQRHNIKDSQVLLAIVRARGSITEAAKILGISRITLWRLITERNLGEAIDEVRVDIERLDDVKLRRPQMKVGEGKWPIITQYDHVGDTDMVRRLLTRAFRQGHGSIMTAAKLLGISKVTVHCFLKHHPDIRALGRTLRAAYARERKERAIVETCTCNNLRGGKNSLEV